jgi:protein-disulfide isomerase
MILKEKKYFIILVIFLISGVLYNLNNKKISKNKCIKKANIEQTIKEKEAGINEEKVIKPKSQKKEIKKEIINNKKQNSMEELLSEFESDVVFGDLNAPITIIEYSSFNCYHCIKMHKNIMKKLEDEYIDTNKVKFVHRAIVNQRTIFAKMLQHCINKKDSLKLTSDLFNTSGEWTYSENILEQLQILYSKYGMDKDNFDKCIENKKLGQSIIDNQNLSVRALGINSTPTFFINNERFVGSRSFNEIKNIIDRKLLELNN